VPKGLALFFFLQVEYRLLSTPTTPFLPYLTHAKIIPDFIEDLIFSFSARGEGAITAPKNIADIILYDAPPVVEHISEWWMLFRGQASLG
jgi:hypothetical protein